MQYQLQHSAYATADTQLEECVDETPEALRSLGPHPIVTLLLKKEITSAPQIIPTINTHQLNDVYGPTFLSPSP